MRLYEILTTFRSKHHQGLTILVAANIVFDMLAIAFWAAFPTTQWSIYQLGFLTVFTEAAIAAALVCSNALRAN